MALECGVRPHRGSRKKQTEENIYSPLVLCISSITINNAQII